MKLKFADVAQGDEELFRIEDYWQNVEGRCWMISHGNPTALRYAVRSAAANLPTDDEVVYGKVGWVGCLVHVSELGEVVEDAK